MWCGAVTWWTERARAAGACLVVCPTPIRAKSARAQRARAVGDEPASLPERGYVGHGRFAPVSLGRPSVSRRAATASGPRAFLVLSSAPSPSPASTTNTASGPRAFCIFWSAVAVQVRSVESQRAEGFPRLLVCGSGAVIENRDRRGTEGLPRSLDSPNLNSTPAARPLRTLRRSRLGIGLRFVVPTALSAAARSLLLPPRREFAVDLVTGSLQRFDGDDVPATGVDDDDRLPDRDLPSMVRASPRRRSRTGGRRTGRRRR